MNRDELSEYTERWKRDLWSAWDGHGPPGPIDPLSWLQARGLSDEYIVKYHLGYVHDGYYGPSISIPILDGLARLKSVRFRRLAPDHPRKYETLRGDRARLFNVSSLRHHLVHLTEGEFDAIVLEQAGYKAVGVPGINNFRKEWRWLFLGNRVRIVFDSDERGTPAYTATKQAVGTIRRLLEPVCDSLDEIELPEGHDVSSLYVADRATFGVLLSDDGEDR